MPPPTTTALARSTGVVTLVRKGGLLGLGQKEKQPRASESDDTGESDGPPESDALRQYRDRLQAGDAPDGAGNTGGRLRCSPRSRRIQLARPGAQDRRRRTREGAPQQVARDETDRAGDKLETGEDRV